MNIYKKLTKYNMGKYIYCLYHTFEDGYDYYKTRFICFTKNLDKLLVILEKDGEKDIPRKGYLEKYIGYWYLKFKRDKNNDLLVIYNINDDIDNIINIPDDINKVAIDYLQNSEYIKFEKLNHHKLEIYDKIIYHKIVYNFINKKELQKLKPEYIDYLKEPFIVIYFKNDVIIQSNIDQPINYKIFNELYLMDNYLTQDKRKELNIKNENDIKIENDTLDKEFFDIWENLKNKWSGLDINSKKVLINSIKNL